MEVGSQVEILSGKHKGRIGTISKIHPGAHYGTWPYYFVIHLEPGVKVEAVKTRLRAIAPTN